MLGWIQAIKRKEVKEMKKYMKFGMIPVATVFALTIGLTPVASANSPNTEWEQRLKQPIVDGFITQEQVDQLLAGEITIKELGTSDYHRIHTRHTGMQDLGWQQQLEEAVANGLINGEEGVDIHEWLGE
jgi:hypothetical protein